MEFLSKHFTEILAFATGLFSGSLLTFSFMRNRIQGGGKIVDQSKSTAGGDIVAGSKINKR